MADLRISGTSTSPRSESDIRVNVGDPSKVLASSNDIANPALAVYYSTNGGASWSTTALPTQPGDTFQADPAVDWTSDGTAWALALGVDASNNIRLYAFTSTDYGANWTFVTTVSGAQTGADRELIWVDRSATSPYKDQVYAAWHNGVPFFFARRTSGTAGTWQAPVQLSGTETTGNAIGGDITTNAFGDLFVFWPDADGGSGMYLRKSTNGGASFGSTVTVATIRSNSRRLNIPAAPTSVRGARVYMSTGAYRTATKDMVYVVWSDLSGETGCTTGNGPGTTVGSTCKTRVWITRSADGGSTWSTPAMINNQSSKNDQFHSCLSVDQTNGVLVVTYSDTVADTNRVKSHVYMQMSQDDGVTWTPAVQVTSAQSDETVSGADGNQYGDYNGLHGHAGTFFPSWTDNRNGIEEIWTSRLSVVPKQAQFILERSSFGQDEVQAMVALSQGTVAPAFFVAVDGFTPSELGITAADLSGTPTVTPTFVSAPSVAGLTFGNPTQLIAADPSLPDVPQRFTWVYPLTFTSDAGFTATVVNVALTATIGSVTASAVIDLIQQPNPYEVDGQTSWLSTDLRVFQAKNGDTRFGAQLNGTSTAAASTFIKAVIGNLNTGATGGQTYENTLSAGDTEVALYPTDSSGTAVFNFAVARVRYRGLLQDASTVRVFFRLFPALTVSLAYDTATTYRQYSDGLPNGQKIGLLGLQNNNILSIPCFAEQRVTPGTTAMTAQADPANVRDILHDPSGAEVVAYFGCLLDINQASEARFPLHPTTDGPYTGTLQSVLSLVRNEHQCLVAELAFDPAPAIDPGDGPSTSDKLAQRNLSLVESDNPGDVGSRRIPNTFEVRPTPASHAAFGLHDEVMFDWRDLPAGTVARIYLPDTGPDQVLELAARLYMARGLTRVDAHTIQVEARGVTYLPIPEGADINHTGLLSIDLPPGVRKGQRFDVVVRQLTHTGRGRKSVVEKGEVRTHASVQTGGQGGMVVWQEVLGAFQVGIPVSTREVLLADELRLLSLMRWILLQIPPGDRWYRAFLRYVDELALRVRGFGGDPSLVEPSPTGSGVPGLPSGHGGQDPHLLGFAGKVSALLYDRYGDFEGFVLDTDRGDMRFDSREHTMEDLADRAWRQRLHVVVRATREAPHKPLGMVLLHGPRPHWG